MDKQSIPADKGPQEPRQEDKASNGHYLAQGIGAGLCFGVVWGQLVLDNPALGIALGLCMGAAMGAAFRRRRR